MDDKKLINEDTKIEVSEDGNTVTFTNTSDNGDVYINTFYLKTKEEVEEPEEDSSKK